MSIPIEPFRTTVTSCRTHGAYGEYSGSAESIDGADAGPWHLTLRHNDQVVHTLTVLSRRRAEFTVRLWAWERVAPDQATAAEVQA